MSRRASDPAAALAVAAALALAGPAAPAQPLAETGDPAARTGIATLNQDALFLQSRFGQRVQRQLEQDRNALAAENRRIESDLMAEERALTERRDELPPEEFARLAEEFDARVERIRREQEAKARNLQDKLDRERRRFLDEVRPILVDLLQRRGAAVVLDSEAVLFAVEGIDITDAAIEAIDARLGDGADGGLAPAVPRPRAPGDGD